ncbi:hypothetical protein [Bradyrhizobium sp. URHD0069]|uniref:hypothetical protein n=1 Tax=Bradyrhizobium sp. URHD0069 TaxID=1380355 RepID=UPI0004970360|nr:hypothetical protein [Bradyrhizobium sp. URHD0069]
MTQLRSINNAADRRHSPDDGLGGGAMDRAVVEVVSAERLRLSGSDRQIEGQRREEGSLHG